MKNAKFVESIPGDNGLEYLIAKDRDNFYLLSSVDNYGLFLGVQISEKNLEEIKNGSKEISGFFRHPKSKLFFPCVFEKGGKIIKLRVLIVKDVIDRFLCPPKGVFAKE